MYPFYHFGMILKNMSVLRKVIDRMLVLPIAAAMVSFVTITIFTYSLNMFNGHDKVVDIATSNHGNILLFPLTAICGSCTIILASCVTPFNRALQRIGQNTLWLLCINGWFYHFFNDTICSLFASYATNSFISVLLLCTLVSCLSIAASLPVATFLAYLYSRSFDQYAIDHPGGVPGSGGSHLAGPG